jgi:lipoprotein-anchoring transpeptidase ErfK/SrfK
VSADQSETGKWIEVDLSQQRLYAHEGQTTVLTAVVSTGIPSYPTRTGRFRVYAKYRSTPMSGPGYYLPGVPWTMFYSGSFAIHGTYWHHNFGHPMSHGCINMKTSEAKWLYDWAPKGTLVVIHK